MESSWKHCRAATGIPDNVDSVSSVFNSKEVGVQLELFTFSGNTIKTFKFHTTNCW